MANKKGTNTRFVDITEESVMGRVESNPNISSAMLGANFSRVVKELQKTFKDLNKVNEQLFISTINNVIAKEEEAYKRLSLSRKKSIADERAQRLKDIEDIYAQDEEQYKKWKAELSKAKEESRRLANEERELKKRASERFSELTGTNKKSRKEEAEGAIESAKSELNSLRSEFERAFIVGDEEEKKYLEEQIRQQQLIVSNAEKSLELQKKSADDYNKGIKVLQQVHDLVGSLGNKINSELAGLYDNQVKFNARTTSSYDAYGNMLGDISDTLGASPFIRQTDVIKNLNEIANTGSNYNIEQRAYLATLANDISSTFNVTGDELLRLNRILHTDLTASRLGMEQNLTKAFNNTFNDSSFMNSLRDSVASGIMDASSQMSSAGGTDFEWAVETWLGSLTAAGVDSSLVNLLTQGFNYLGSGNISAMSGNEQLQTLFALAASNSGGKSYSEMLVDGIDASDVNILMREMVSYLKEISEENKVVQSEYSRILGINGLANLRALGNIDIDTISNIATNANTNIDSSYYKTSSLLNIVNTVKSNLLTGIASDIGENPARLLTWITSDLLDSLVGGIKLPSLFAMGTGVGLNTSVADLMKVGVLATDVVNVGKSIGTALKALTSTGIADYSDFTAQAGGLGANGFGTSLSYAVGSSSLSDIKKSSLASQAKEAKANQKTVKSAIGGDSFDAEQDLHTIRTQVDNLYVDDLKPVYVHDNTLDEILEAINASSNKPQKIEGTVVVSDFDSASERKMNDALANATALLMKMFMGGGNNGSDVSISSGDYGWSGYFGNTFVGSMSFSDLLNRIVTSNENTMSQIVDILNVFANKSSEYNMGGFVR